MKMAGKKSASALQDHLGYWLRFVSNHVSDAFARKVESRGVTVAEWVLMRAMADAGAANPSQIAAAMGMTRGAVSKLVERLCRKNLAARSADSADKRYQTIELTDAGKRLVPELAALADANDHEFFGHLEPDDRLRITALLQGIVRRNDWKDIPVH